MVPLGEIRRAERVELPTRAAVTGVARSGLVVSGILKLGRRGIGTPTSRFVSVRRWVLALRLVVDDRFRKQLGYHEILISTPDVDELVESLAALR